MKLAVALGGNALIKANQEGTFEQQIDNVKGAGEQIVNLIQDGHEVILTHGNGPQVGNLVLQNDISREQTATMPLYACGAMTQGQIGYMLQQQVKNQLLETGINKEVVSMVSQTVVDENDPKFQNPTKPIGSFYSEEEAKQFMEEKGETWVEDSGRGWRKVVPSPQPQDIVEKDAIKRLFEDSYVVIASGGGGIPVVEKEGQYQGVEGVIDKDLAGELLAELIEVDTFIILTDVPFVAIDFGKPSQKDLHNITVDELKTYEEQGHFAQGSMAPKVRACINFVENTGNKAIITSLDQVDKALKGETGTHVTVS